MKVRLSRPAAIPGPEIYSEKDIREFKTQLGGPPHWPDGEWPPRRLVDVYVDKNGVIVASFETLMAAAPVEECEELKLYAQIPLPPGRKPGNSKCEQFREVKV